MRAGGDRFVCEERNPWLLREREMLEGCRRSGGGGNSALVMGAGCSNMARLSLNPRAITQSCWNPGLRRTGVRFWTPDDEVVRPISLLGFEIQLR